MFIHEDPDFLNLIGIVAGKRGLALAIVEKGYWVTHALWSLGNAGFDVWFKGGTSLSKGFDLIQRFSEDLDLKLEHSRSRSPQTGGMRARRIAASVRFSSEASKPRSAHRVSRRSWRLATTGDGGTARSSLCTTAGRTTCHQA
jgi:predicted nucleotidyltransferase component of viral defense system